MNLNDEVQRLHKIYCELTCHDYPLPVGRYYLWENFIARGYGEAELRIVINNMNRGIRNQERREGCLRLCNLLLDMDTFAEELAMARKVFRKKPAYSPQKAAVLRATGRHDEPATPEARSVGVIAERMKLASMLQQWRTSNL